MRVIFGFSLLLAAMAITPASAQGTARQRSACTDDAYRLCESVVPDAAAVEQCLKANFGSLSRPCRKQLQSAAKAKKRGRRH
jgi:hypothetical protein